MDYIYRQLLEHGLDLSPLGILAQEVQSGYFCTPAGADVFGWSGGDGVHYCFLEAFGDMVFAVSPMNSPGEYVHPLARSFSDFLRLLLSCGNADALEQAWCLDAGQFSDYLVENPITPEQRAVLDNIQAIWGLAPMEEPFAYVRELQAGFDYHKIPFVGDYDFFPPAPPEHPEQPASQEWAVYFRESCGFRDGRKRPGIPLSIRRDFIWQGRYCLIPEVYACGKGLVMDLCIQIPAHALRAFQEKWEEDSSTARPDLPRGIEMQIEAENPLNVQFSLHVTLNGRPLPGASGSGSLWMPSEAEQPYMREAEQTLIHYGLDRDSGWSLWRYSFPWATKRRPKHFSTLDVLLEPSSVALPGPCFTVNGPGDQIRLSHPETGIAHVLTVQEYEQQERPQPQFYQEDFEFPTHYTGMCYTLKPDLTGHEFSVQDAEDGDPPRPRADSAKKGYCAVSILSILHVDEDTPIRYGGEGQGKPHGAASSPCFSPKPQVTWRSIFFVTRGRPLSVSLL